MKCQRCKEREGIIEFSYEPTNAIIRGWGLENICRGCYIAIVESELKKIKTNLKKQKILLEKEIIIENVKKMRKVGKVEHE